MVGKVWTHRSRGGGRWVWKFNVADLDCGGLLTGGGGMVKKREGKEEGGSRLLGNSREILGIRKGGCKRTEESSVVAS